MDVCPHPLGIIYMLFGCVLVASRFPFVMFFLYGPDLQMPVKVFCLVRSNRFKIFYSLYNCKSEGNCSVAEVGTCISIFVIYKKNERCNATTLNIKNREKQKVENDYYSIIIFFINSANCLELQNDDFK